MEEYTEEEAKEMTEQVVDQLQNLEVIPAGEVQSAEEIQGEVVEEEETTPWVQIGDNDPLEEMKQNLRKVGMIPARETAIGITRKNKEESKHKIRIRENSAKINRNKHRHHKTRKEKKFR